MKSEIAQDKYQQNIVKLDVRVGDENAAVDKLKAKLKDGQYYLDKMWARGRIHYPNFTENRYFFVLATATPRDSFRAAIKQMPE
ncbi:hypothetical protein [Buttiauxella gaviniae]|uniref:hypothetical protein n=1 Tax=Buttiauxella gaviniae TaxID=82990 RepID=UPI003976B9AE